jgi:hypothetical protein
MTTRDIQAQVLEMYGVEVSPTLISNVTDAVMDEVRQQGCFILQKPHSAMSISLTCSTSNKAFAALDSHLHPMQS